MLHSKHNGAREHWHWHCDTQRFHTATRSSRAGSLLSFSSATRAPRASETTRRTARALPPAKATAWRRECACFREMCAAPAGARHAMTAISRSSGFWRRQTPATLGDRASSRECSRVRIYLIASFRMQFAKHVFGWARELRFLHCDNSRGQSHRRRGGSRAAFYSRRGKRRQRRLRQLTRRRLECHHS